MTSAITLPLWIVVLGALALALMIIERALLPSARWVLRRRLQKGFSELNKRLQLQVQPLTLTRRQVLVDRLIYDPQIMAAVQDEADAEGVPREVIAEQAAKYAREIVPAFLPVMYFGFGIRFARFIAQTLYRVRLGHTEEAALGEIDPNATVVFVMNHRSNLDYLLVTYLAADRTHLSYAVGEWARVWPLKLVVRAMGAFFIRRRSRNPLYRKVLARYVQMATEGGVTQAVFPEGGLSRDGRVGQAKLGFLSYLVEGFDMAASRDVVFVPVAMNYDRVLEDRILIAAQTDAQGRPRFRAGALSSAGFFFKLVWLRLRGKYHRFGYASVSFGHPVSLRGFLEAPGREDAIAELGAALMAEVGRVVPVLPVSLMATVLQEADGPLPEAELRSRALALKDSFVAAGGHFHLPRDDFDYAVDAGLRLLRKRRVLVEREGVWSIAAGEEAVLSYYANTIEHLPRA